MLSRYEQFSFVISGIYRYIQKLEHDEMIQHGYKGAFAQYLMAMVRFPDGITSAKLCEICDKDKAAVSRILSEMEAKELIRRESENGKGYNAKIKLTETGKSVAEFVAARAQTAVEAIGNTMNEEERKTFYHTLDAIAANLQTLSQTGIPQNETSQRFNSQGGFIE